MRTRSKLAHRLCGTMVLALALTPGSSRAGALLSTDPAGDGQGHENHQPALGIRFLVAIDGAVAPRNEEDPPAGPNRFVGEIGMFAGSLVPEGWASADGQLLAVSTGNNERFGALGTTFGGDGGTTFALPDLRSRSPVRFGNGPGLTPRSLGQEFGVERVTLNENQMPAHTHTMASPIGATSTTGGGQSHDNTMPSLAINSFGSSGDGFLRMGGFNYTPFGHAPADGSDPNVPDLRGRLSMSSGQGTGLTNRLLGDIVGSERVTLTESQLPTHRHTSPDGDTGDTGGGQPHLNMQPTTALNYIIATNGMFPVQSDGDDTYSPTNPDTPLIGEVRLFSGDTPPNGWLLADGAILPITQYTALFAIIGNAFGGNGAINFGLPDLRGRVPVHTGQGPGLRNWTRGEKHGVESVTLSLNELPSHSHDYTALLPGDADGDGDVDLADFNILAANFGLGPAAPGGAAIGDFNWDGSVDLDDFNLLAANFGLGNDTVTTLPEPGLAILLTLGGVAIVARRR